jgi:membrane protein CcdC involved in cytochrome C biogenesis
MHIPLMFPAVASVVGLVVIMAWRIQEGRRPVTLRKLLAPPLGMATGFSMFLFPIFGIPISFRVPWSWAIAAFLIGAVLLAWPLLRTSRLERVGDVIWMKRSGAFFTVVIVLAAVRYLARNYFDSRLTLEQTGGLFFILAFGMILRWRLTLYMQYRALSVSAQQSSSLPQLTEQEQDLPA